MNKDFELKKSEIRKLIKEEKKKLTNEFICLESKKIFERLYNHSEYKQAEDIFCYVSYNQEVNTREFIDKILSSNKKLAVPKVVEKNKIVFYYINKLSELKKGVCGILEPSSNCIKAVPRKNTLMIVPGLAFDKKGGRLGYGGGFYDMYLESYKNNLGDIMALAFEFQIIDCVPTQDFDFRVNKIITPADIIVCS